MMRRFKDNLWRGYGVLALAYIIFWWVMLFVWFIPLQSGVLVTLSVGALAFVFVTVGLFGMIFSFFVVRACFER
jgi:hypothetical protein